MATSDWIAALICVALLPAWAVIVGPVWHDRRPDLRSEPPGLWPFGGPLWRAGIRLIPVGGPAIFVALPVAVLQKSQADGLVADAALGMFGFLAVVALLLLISIILFNSPKRLVAPHLRSQPGLLEERFGKDTGTRSRTGDEPPRP